MKLGLIWTEVFLEVLPSRLLSRKGRKKEGRRSLLHDIALSESECSSIGDRGKKEGGRHGCQDKFTTQQWK